MFLLIWILGYMNRKTSIYYVWECNLNVPAEVESCISSTSCTAENDVTFPNSSLTQVSNSWSSIGKLAVVTTWNWWDWLANSTVEDLFTCKGKKMRSGKTMVTSKRQFTAVLTNKLRRCAFQGKMKKKLLVWNSDYTNLIDNSLILLHWCMQWFLLFIMPALGIKHAVP